jgi:hypothetical protein
LGQTKGKLQKTSVFLIGLDGQTKFKILARGTMNSQHEFEPETSGWFVPGPGLSSLVTAMDESHVETLVRYSPDKTINCVCCYR